MSKFPFSKAVVTGGAGFIGSHVVEALISRDVDVLVIDNLVTGQQKNISNDPRVSFVEADICSAEASAAVLDWKPELVFHLAAQINVRKSVEDPNFDATANVVGTVNMLDSAARAGAAKFLFASTGGAIYGEQDYFPADEQHPIRPKCPYGVSKRAGEQYLSYYGQNSAMKTVSLRLSNVYGPRQNPKGEAGVVAIFTDRLLRGETLVVNGDGEQTRDFIYVGDVVEAAMLAAISETTDYTIFNVGRGEEISVNQVVTSLREAWSAAEGVGEMNVSNGPALAGEQMRSVIAPSKIQSELGWQPQTAFADGLSKTLDSFLNA